MRQKWFSIVVVMILLSLFSACSKKEAEPEEVITFKSAESETAVETPAVQNEEPPTPVPVADTEAPADVKDLIASSGDGSVMLSWTNPTDEDFTKVVITYGIDGTAVVRGAPGGIGKQYISDLKNGVEYTFTLMAVDKTGNASEGKQVSSTPVSPTPVKPVETPVAKPTPTPSPAPKPEPVKQVVTEPEPVVEPVTHTAQNTLVSFIWSSDGNIAAGTNTVFSKTSEVTVLAKATSIELNKKKSLISAYSMGKYPVTQELFEAVMGINPSKCVDSSNLYVTAAGEITKLKPCEKVSWYDAIAFCNKLSLLLGYEPCYYVSGIDDWNALVYEDIPTEYNTAWSDASCDFTRNGFRLPTESEWEVAARGGNPAAAEWNYSFSGKDSKVREATNKDLDSVGWYKYNICNGGVTSNKEPAAGAGYGTHETGLKAPNSLSLFDMCGNVWEWCWDSCKTTDDNSTFEVDPISGVPADSCRALRGGSWGIDASCCDIPSRLVEYEFYRSARYGFRLVRTGAAN
jgi:formylglycine-generating enzyme required for sulfatase activity